MLNLLMYHAGMRTQALGISSVAFTRSISIIAASTKMLLTCQACFCFCLTLLLSNDNSSAQVRVLNPGKHCGKNIGDFRIISSKVGGFIFLTVAFYKYLSGFLALFLSYTLLSNDDISALVRFQIQETLWEEHRGLIH